MMASTLVVVLLAASWSVPSAVAAGCTLTPGSTLSVIGKALTTKKLVVTDHNHMGPNPPVITTTTTQASSSLNACRNKISLQKLADGSFSPTSSCPAAVPALPIGGTANLAGCLNGFLKDCTGLKAVPHLKLSGGALKFQVQAKARNLFESSELYTYTWTLTKRNANVVTLTQVATAFYDWATPCCDGQRLTTFTTKVDYKVTKGCVLGAVP